MHTLELESIEALFLIDCLEVILRRFQNQIVRSKVAIRNSEKKLEIIRAKNEKKKNRSWSIILGETKEDKHKRIISEERAKIDDSRFSYNSSKTIYLKLINQVWKDFPDLIKSCIEKNDNFKERETMFIENYPNPYTNGKMYF